MILDNRSAVVAIIFVSSIILSFFFFVCALGFLDLSFSSNG